MRDKNRENGTDVAREMEKWMFWGDRPIWRAQHTVCLWEMSAEKVIDTWKP